MITGGNVGYAGGVVFERMTTRGGVEVADGVVNQGRFSISCIVGTRGIVRA
jgi:hypothetical protein